MKKYYLLFLYILCSLPDNLLGQCNFITPPELSKFDYANREVTFSNCLMNGKKTTVLQAQKGETITIEVTMSVRQNGNYCPGCIVQIYWGINNYVSTCATSFYGYNVRPMTTKQRFMVPDKDGVYYITMGGSLEYSCINNPQRPVCDPNYAFAVLIVGSPDAEKKMTLNVLNNSTGLETTLLKSGCFGLMNELKWYRNGTRLEGENSTRLSANTPGTYRAVWKNCVGDSIYMEKTIEGSTIVKDTTSLDYQIENSNKFTLNNLQFDVQSPALTEYSKRELDKLAKVLKDRPTIKIRLEGHTDVVGSPKLNLKLSEQRVISAKKYLIQKGISGSRIATKGFGGTRPISNGTTEEEQRKNRRVEIVILSR